MRWKHFSLLSAMAGVYFWWAATALGADATAPAATEPTTIPASTVPADRLAKLARGVNLQNWMWPQHGAKFDDPIKFRAVSDAELEMLHAMGMTHVRLPIEPDALVNLDRPTELAPKTLAAVDEGIRRIVAHGLAVVVDFHASKKFETQIAVDDKSAEAYVTFWKTLAAHLSSTDPDWVFFEYINEPQAKDLRVQSEMVAAVRSVAPRHTIVVTGPGWSGITSMHLIQLVPDSNVIYTFHFYEPMTFTHQWATWAGPTFKDLKDVPYPSTPELIAPLMENYPAKSQERAWLKTYGDQRWDEDRILSRIKVAADWSAANHVPLWCGEFGVYATKATPPDSRVRWIGDVRTAIEHYHIGWCMWDYDGGFHLVRRNKDGSAKPDPDLDAALGLTTPPSPSTATSQPVSQPGN